MYRHTDIEAISRSERLLLQTVCIWKTGHNHQRSSVFFCKQSWSNISWRSAETQWRQVPAFLSVTEKSYDQQPMSASITRDTYCTTLVTPDGTDNLPTLHYIKRMLEK